MSLERILVPVDGSEPSYQSLEAVCTVGRVTGAEVIIIHVLVLPPYLPLMEPAPPPLVRQAEAVVDRAERIARKQGVRFEAEIVQSREVGTAIVAEAESRNVQAIALALRRQHTPLETIYIGSTVRYILNNAPCAVCITHFPGAHHLAISGRPREAE